MTNERPAPASPQLRFVLYILVYSLPVFIIIAGCGLLLVRSLVPSLGGVGASVVAGLIVLTVVAFYIRAHRRLRARERVVIARPVEEVFRRIATECFATRAEVIARAVPPGTSFTVEQTSAGPVGVGTTGHELIELDGQRGEWFYLVTAYDPPRCFTLTLTLPPAPVQLHIRYDLAPVLGGTQLTVTSDFAPLGQWRFFTPYYSRRYEGYIRGRAARWKEFLEA